MQLMSANIGNEYAFGAKAENPPNMIKSNKSLLMAAVVSAGVKPLNPIK